MKLHTQEVKNLHQLKSPLSDLNLLNKNSFLKFKKWGLKGGGFQLIQILGPLGMYFDAFLLFFRLALAILGIIFAKVELKAQHSSRGEKYPIEN